MRKDERYSRDLKLLFDVILRLQTQEECRLFFEDICTISEMNEMAKRLRVAVLLREGKSYLQISKETGVSTATISRVNRCLEWGDGGYSLALDRLEENAACTDSVEADGEPTAEAVCSDEGEYA